MPLGRRGGRATLPIRLRVISLGAGVQSTTLALLGAHGEVGPMPDSAIFADTGWEPEAVYQHLAWLMSPNVLPFPVHIVSAGNIRDNLIAAGCGRRWASIPAVTRTTNRRGKVSIGMIRRQCTGDYKIDPIRCKVRELVGLTRKRSPAIPVVEQWIGISTDEIVRMKPSFARAGASIAGRSLSGAWRAATACAGSTAAAIRGPRKAGRRSGPVD